MLISMALLASYLLGSLSGSLILGRVVGVDIRQSGSGNAGGTNAFRTRGWRFALGVVVIDVGKGVLAALVPVALDISAVHVHAVQAACVLLAAAGHTWPVFFGFRGGKGAATLAGGLAVIWPLALPWVLATWLLVLFSTGYVGLSSILSVAMLIALAWFNPGTLPEVRLVLSLLATLLILYTHRSNLQRLLTGNEPRFERLRLFARLFAHLRSR